MATIQKRGAYQWRVQVRRRGFPPQSKTFDSKVDAQAWAQMIESEMSRGIWVSRGEAEVTTLFECLTRYKAEIVPGKKGAAQEKSIILMLTSHKLAQRAMATIRSSDVATLRDEWLKEGYAAATVLRRLALLSHVFSIARREWGLESLSNPVELVRKPPPGNARSRRLIERLEVDRGSSEDELERIIAVSGSSVLPLVIRLAVETAMRRGEIVGLRWENLDLVRRVAHLPETKNGASRDVPLSPAAVEALSVARVAAEAIHTASKSKARILNGPVFNVRSDAITRAFERAVARARKAYEVECEELGRQPDQKFLTNLRLHDLRHEAASRLATVYQLHELTKVTGHKDPRMLMRYYHPRAEDLAKRLG